MKLPKVRVGQFRSIWNSNEFEIEEVTCLVGKNEAGKTANLMALYRMNPPVNKDATFNATEDYPREYVKDYTRSLKGPTRRRSLMPNIEEKTIRIVSL